MPYTVDIHYIQFICIISSNEPSRVVYNCFYGTLISKMGHCAHRTLPKYHLRVIYFDYFFVVSNYHIRIIKLTHYHIRCDISIWALVRSSGLCEGIFGTFRVHCSFDNCLVVVGVVIIIVIIIIIIISWFHLALDSISTKRITLKGRTIGQTYRQIYNINPHHRP